MYSPSNSSSRWPAISGWLPAVVRWRSFHGAFVNVLLFGLTALAGEWLAHQLEYRIEYGSSYGAVMAGSPHRYYMMPLGLVFAVAGLALAALIVLALTRLSSRRRRAMHMLSDRVRRHAALPAEMVPAGAVGRTALALVLLQMVLYVVQENLEWFAITNSWPWLSVILAPQHRTVFVVDALVAVCGALILWAIAMLVRRSHRLARAAEALAAAFGRRPCAPPVITPIFDRVPTLIEAVGILCPRSPPLVG